MAVLVEAYSVVVKTESLQRVYPCGFSSFKKQVLKHPYCFDEAVISIHFTDADDLEFFVDDIILRSNNQLTIDDFALIDMIEGVMTNNNWLRFIRGKIFAHRSEFKNCMENFAIAYIPEKYIIETDIVHTIRFPLGWTPDKAILGNDFITKDRLESDFYFIDDENGQKLAFLKDTNEQVFI